MITNKNTMMISGCTRTELGLAYCPHDTPAAARKLLMRWITFHPTLSAELKQTGYSPTCRRLTPHQVQLIMHALGDPCC